MQLFGFSGKWVLAIARTAVDAAATLDRKLDSKWKKLQLLQ